MIRAVKRERMEMNGMLGGRPAWAQKIALGLFAKRKKLAKHSDFRTSGDEFKATVNCLTLTFKSTSLEK